MVPACQVRLSFGLACHSKSNHYLPHSTRDYEAISSQSGVDRIDIFQKISKAPYVPPDVSPVERKKHNKRPSRLQRRHSKSKKDLVRAMSPYILIHSSVFDSCHHKHGLFGGWRRWWCSIGIHPRVKYGEIARHVSPIPFDRHWHLP